MLNRYKDWLRTMNFHTRMNSASARFASLAAIIIVALGGLFSAAPVHAAESGVVIMYHRFGDDRYPKTNIRLEQFDAHLVELSAPQYSVLPVHEMITRLQSGGAIQNRAVGITIDDAYASVYEHAWPRLRDANLPFTLFVSTDAVDQSFEGMMTWDQIRELVAGGVTIAAHTGSHLHMPEHSEGRILDEIERSNRRFYEELGFIPKLFAYPYGEVSQRIAQQVRDAGYKAAFGQHSGAFSAHDNQFYLPRFPLNEDYGDMGRFKTAVNALALPISDMTPEDMSVREQNPPAIGFTLRKPLKRIDELSCFLSHEGAVAVQWLGDVRVEIRAETPFTQSRTRLNCTLPGADEDAGRWYWFGWQFYKFKGN